MSFKVIFLKLIKSIYKWIFYLIIFFSMNIFSITYFVKGTTYTENNIKVPIYHSIKELEEIEKDLKKSKQTPIINKDLNKILDAIKGIKENDVKYDDFYFRDFKYLKKDRYDFLHSAVPLIFVIVFISSIFITYKIFGQDFNNQRSYTLIYHNKEKIPSLFKRMSLILAINFVIFSVFSLLLFLLSLVFQKSHNYIIYNYSDFTKVYKFNTYFFIYFYIRNFYNMLLIYLLVNNIFLLILKRVISLVNSIFTLIVVFCITFIIQYYFNELTQPIFGESSLGVTNTVGVLIRIY